MNRKRKLSSLSMAVLSIIILVSCSNPKDSEEFKKLASDVQSIESEVDGLETDIDSLQSQIAEGEASQTKLQNVMNQRLELLETVSRSLSDPSTRREIVNGVGEQACKAYVTAIEAGQGVGNFRDEGFYDAAEASLSGTENILGNIYSKFDYESEAVKGWKAYWSELEATNCRKEATTAFYKKCETFDKRQMNKNPGQFKGKCVKGTLRIAQFDSNTGPCSFQGYIGGGYDVRAQFGQVVDPDKHDEEKECEWTSKLVEDNFITFWAWGLGSYSYDTTSGGKQTVPAFKMVQYSK